MMLAHRSVLKQTNVYVWCWCVPLIRLLSGCVAMHDVKM